MRKKSIFAVFLLAVVSSLASAQSVVPLSSVANLDVPRYLGRWYEIAKFPNRFQKKCIAETTAEYALQPDGSLSVLNQCRQANGEFDYALGHARQIGGSHSAKLEVRFAPSWLGFLPFVWGNYWVIDLDAEYQLAAVGEPNREYLWILSRTPQVDSARYEALLARLKGLGFDTQRLEVTNHPTANSRMTRS
jgi:apolipoprotein D and lipocalin family protein